MRKRTFRSVGVLLALAAARGAWAAEPVPAELRVGVAQHAFDHLGNIGEQADAATAAGFNVLYTTGVGSLGYAGLPASAELDAAVKTARAYNDRAKRQGARLAIGYVCATSIVGLDTFAKNWTLEFRGQFSTPPSEWLQQGKDGRPLASWYGGAYRPACMSNPDWRAYEKAIVRMQLEAGHDGIFFDNPTVHPDGCYCPYCMKAFAAFLAGRHVKVPPAASVEELRKLAVSRREDFLRFRATVARDFIGEMRAYARTINPRAYVTCNNSLNAPEAFYSQCRTYGYDIEELAKVEDWVTVEDMGSQPRVQANGAVVEYGPVYELLRAVSHGKPLVAVTIAEGDYHTPGNLVRLAMAEAAAHGASYLGWPTWPEEVRGRMVGAVRPEADFLREHADLLNDTTPRADVVVYMPFQRWVGTDSCPALAIARALTAADISYRVVAEEDFSSALRGPAHLLVVESLAVLTAGQKREIERYIAAGGHVVTAESKDWLADLRAHAPCPSVALAGPPTCRVIVRDQAGRTVVHLLNLNVRRLSSFEDQVTPADHVRVTVWTPVMNVKSVTALTADRGATDGPVPFTVAPSAGGNVVTVELPTLHLSTILLVE